MFRNIAVGLAVLGLSAGVACAQEDLLAELYGQGVHAYFTKDFVDAHAQFTAAIEQASTDPRCYYFRGLAYIKLGRPEDAEQDFARGAALEIEERQYYPIGRSLERIQGPERLQLERARQKARIAAINREQLRNRHRYERREEVEERVLRPPVDPDRTDEPIKPIEDEDIDVAGEGGDPTNPFGGSEADRLGRGDPSEVPGDVPKPGDDVFGDDEPVDKPAEDLSADGTKPVDKPEDDVFGGGAEPDDKPEDDVFGGGAEPADKPEDDVFGGGAEPADKPEDDVFGGGAEPADKPADEPGAAKRRPLGSLWRAFGKAVGGDEEKDAPDAAPGGDDGPPDDPDGGGAEPADKPEDDVFGGGAEPTDKPEDDVFGGGAEPADKPEDDVFGGGAEPADKPEDGPDGGGAEPADDPFTDDTTDSPF